MELTIAQIFIAQKQYPKALAAIADFLEYLETTNILYFRVSALAWQALAYDRSGQEPQALASLSRALTMAAPEGYVRSFFLGNGAFVPLLSQARAMRILPGYVDRLLEAIPQEGKPRPSGAAGLIEPLSEREVEVLKLLAQGCSDKRISETLVIARDTVHTHLKNIYGKLDVHSRTEAIARARELGML